MKTNGKMSLVELANKLEKQKETKKDYIFSPKNISILVDEEEKKIKMDMPIPVCPKCNSKNLIINDEGKKFECEKCKTKGVVKNLSKQHEKYPLTEIAHGHVAEKTPIGRRYYNRMIADGKLDLLKDNLESYFPEQTNKMFRILDTEGDGIPKIRAILSNSYRIIDNYDVLMHTMETISKLGNMDIHFKDVRLSETRLYIKALSKKLIDEIHRPNRKKDIVEGGIIIMNSEVGYGKYKCIPFMNVVRCQNGLIGEETFTKIHLGMKKNEGLINWSDNTIQKNDELLWSKIKDVVKSTFNPKIFESWVDKINNISTIEFEEPTVAFNNVVKSFKIPKHKRDELLMKFGDEDKTLWGMSNAITNVAQTEKNYDNQIEFEELGNKVLKAKPQEIAKIVA